MTHRILTRRPFASFVVLTFGITLIGHGLHELGVHGVIPRFRMFDRLAGAGPSVAGVVMTLVIYGRKGLRELLARLLPWKCSVFWLLLCLFLPLAAALINVACLSLSGIEIPQVRFHVWPVWLFRVVTYTFLSAGIAEEIGWRGFAQPELQRSRSAFTSSIIIGIVWALWHYPKWFIVWGYTFSWLLFVFIGLYTIAVVAMAVVYGVLHKTTHASLFAAVLFHGSFDASGSFVQNQLFPGNNWNSSYLPLIYVAVIWCVIGAIFVSFNRSSMFTRPIRDTSEPNTRVNRSGESGRI